MALSTRERRLTPASADRKRDGFALPGPWHLITLLKRRRGLRRLIAESLYRQYPNLRSAMNSELLGLYQADRREHSSGFKRGTREYVDMRERDRQRRQRVAEIMAEGNRTAPVDYYHAAWIFNHGDTPEDAWQGHTLAKQAAALDYRPARWLAAATYDRWLMYQGKPQKYGTQCITDGKRHRLWDVEAATTDAERAEWDVPPLAEQLRKAEEATRIDPPGPIGEEAPRWLKEALKRWNSEEAA